MRRVGLVVDLAPWPGEAGHLSIEGLRAPLHDFLGDGRVWQLAAGSGAPPAGEAVAGVILSGSSAFVREAPAWMDTLAAAVDVWRRRGTPILGTCFGHQFLAHHLGGRLGTYESPRAELAPLHILAARDPLFAGVPRDAPMLWSHQDHVTKLPPSCVRLAGSDACPVEAFRSKTESVWGLQSHPESSAALAEAVAKVEPASRPSYQTHSPADYATAAGARILRNFALIAQTSQR